jgi:hypothetical protein
VQSRLDPGDVPRRWLGALSLAAGLLTTAPAVWASNTPAERDALARFEEGLQRVKAGDFDAARLSFVEAYAALHRPRILWNLALSEEKTGRTLEALTHFRQVAADSGAVEADRADARVHVSALSNQTGHIDVQAPAGAVIAVDGARVPDTTPLSDPLDVEPGHHVVEAKLGESTASLTIDAGSGLTVHADFSAMNAVKPPPPPSPAEPSPVAPSQVPDEPPAEPSSEPGLGRAVAVGGLAAGAVAAVTVGVILAGKSRDERNTAAAYGAQYGPSACATPGVSICAQWNDAVENQRRDAAWATGLYVGGGVLAAGAVVTWLAWPSGTSRWAKLLPSIDPRRIGMSFAASF